MAIPLTPEQEVAIRALKIDDLTRKFIELRGMKETLVDQHKASLERCEAGMKKLEVLMLCWLQLYGLESAPTKFGTRTPTSVLTCVGWFDGRSSVSEPTVPSRIPAATIHPHLANTLLDCRSPAIDAGGRILGDAETRP